MVCTGSGEQESKRVSNQGWGSGRYRPGGQVAARGATYDFAEQDDVLAADEKHAAFDLGVALCWRVEQALDRHCQHEVGWARSRGGRQR